MNIRYRSLFSVIAVAATLCWQAPAFADPPSRTYPGGGQGHSQDQHGDRGGDRREDRPSDHRNDHYDQDRRNERNGDRERGGQPPYYSNNRWRDDPRYPRYPLYPVRPAYPVYPIYPRYPAYYAYRGYPGYYGYYGPHLYRGYYGDPWRDDYGVVSTGRCNSNAVLGVAGAVTGAIIGNSASAPQNRGIATVFGAIAGGIIGTAVGSAIDEGDRACIGQSLELAPIGRPVVWINPRSRIHWQVVPVRDVSAECREFDVRRDYYGRYGTERVTACRHGPGQWMFSS